MQGNQAFKDGDLLQAKKFYIKSKNFIDSDKGTQALYYQNLKLGM